MADSYLVVLDGIIRQANDAAVPPVSKVKRILRLLQRSLALHDATLFFRRGRQGRFSSQISARGRSGVVSPPGQSPPKMIAGTSPVVSSDGSRTMVPVRHGRRQLAVLVLCGASPAPAEARDFFCALSSLLSPLLAQIGSSQGDVELEELSLLNRLSQALHTTLQLDIQMHLLLSGLALPEGGFERTMLFMVNERSGILQGMLGVTAETARKLFSLSDEERSGAIGRTLIEEQAHHEFSRRVRQQRLPFDPQHNPVARAALRREVVFVGESGAGSGQYADMAQELGLRSCACLPLHARDRTRAVIVAESLKSAQRSRQRRFLELFAKQAGQALENALLVQRLEHAHEELQATQEQLIQGEKLAAIGEMAASVAHELKNPLVVVGGFAKRLTRLPAGDGRSRDYAETIAREVSRLEKMLGNLLAFSRKSVVCLSWCDPAQIVEEALPLGRGGPNQDGIRYELAVEGELPRLQGDEQKLRQVLVNLLVNARQSLDGGGTITVRAARGMLRGDKAVVFQVDDTGGGIPASILRNIFNPFFTTRDEGTGLGLSIVQRIVEQHYGHIEVENTERGARFRVSLPLSPPHAGSV